MQSMFKRTDGHIRLAEASIFQSRDRTHHHKFPSRPFEEQFPCSRIRRLYVDSSIKGAARASITTLSMREMVTQQEPMQVTRHRSRISTGRFIPG